MANATKTTKQISVWLETLEGSTKWIVSLDTGIAGSPAEESSVTLATFAEDDQAGAEARGEAEAKTRGIECVVEE